MRKKNKKSPEELAKERDARINLVADKLKVQILTMEQKKGILLGKVIEARQKGLKSQEEQARGLLRKCLATHKQASGMLMTLELAVQSRDLAVLNNQFIECIGTLSEDIQFAAGKTNAKKSEKKYLKALYISKKQSEELDEMLEVGDYAAMAGLDSDKFAEFNEEIDSLVELAESGSLSNRNPNKQKN